MDLTPVTVAGFVCCRTMHGEPALVDSADYSMKIEVESLDLEKKKKIFLIFFLIPEMRCM